MKYDVWMKYRAIHWQIAIREKQQNDFPNDMYLLLLVYDLTGTEPCLQTKEFIFFMQIRQCMLYAAGPNRHFFLTAIMLVYSNRALGLL